MMVTDDDEVIVDMDVWRRKRGNQKVKTNEGNRIDTRSRGTECTSMDARDQRRDEKPKRG